MTTLKNTTGTKLVNISKDATGTFRAFYCDVYKGKEQVLDSKSYATEKRALKWAESKLD